VTWPQGLPGRWCDAVPDAGYDSRERPWRATSRGGTVDLDTSTPAGAAAAAAVGLAHIDRSRALAEEFAAGERNEPEEWQDGVALTSADVWLTPDEARRVRVMTMLTPHPKR
jgi:hypothetical protein